jgi:hypothetical protein
MPSPPPAPLGVLEDEQAALTLLYTENDFMKCDKIWPLDPMKQGIQMEVEGVGEARKLETIRTRGTLLQTDRPSHTSHAYIYIKRRRNRRSSSSSISEQ